MQRHRSSLRAEAAASRGVTTGRAPLTSSLAEPAAAHDMWLHPLICQALRAMMHDCLYVFVGEHSAASEHSAVARCGLASARRKARCTASARRYRSSTRLATVDPWPRQGASLGDGASANQEARHRENWTRRGRQLGCLRPRVGDGGQGDAKKRRICRKQCMSTPRGRGEHAPGRRRRRGIEA